MENENKDNDEDNIIISQLQGLTNETTTKLLAKDANALVIRLLQAIVINRQSPIFSLVTKNTF